MKRLLTLLMLSSSMLLALSSISSLPTNEKILLKQLLTRLNIPKNISEDTKEKIYKKMRPFLKSGWSSHWMSNVSVANSKIKKSETQVVDLMIYNNNRVTNLTFIYFAKEKQLFTSSKEFIETKSKNAMERYRKLEKNKDYSKESENDNYAYFQEKGYISYVGFHIVKPVGLIVYEGNNIIDIKEEKIIDEKVEIKPSKKDTKL